MLICNVEANYQFATLQSCFIIRSQLNFFCVLVPASDIWLLYNRGCWGSVFFITSYAGDIELLDLHCRGSCRTLAHVPHAPQLPSTLKFDSLAAIFVSQRKHWGTSDQLNISHHTMSTFKDKATKGAQCIQFQDSFDWDLKRDGGMRTLIGILSSAI